MGRVEGVGGQNFWRDLASDQACEATRKQKAPHVLERTPDLPDRIGPHPLAEKPDPASGAPSLFRASPGRPDIDIRDIGQRAFGDCGLLSAVGVLTRTGEGRALIRGMIAENRDGAGNVLSYTVRLHRCSAPNVEPRVLQRVDVTVSAAFPVGHASTSRDGVPGNRAEVWVAVIEKAYAELKGGYGVITTGDWPCAAFEALTGKPGAQVEPSRYDAKRLVADVAANKPVTFSTTAFALPNAYGLQATHAYMAVGTQRDARGNVCVVLENPWGDSDPKPIPVKDFAAYFTYVDVGEL